MAKTTQLEIAREVGLDVSSVNKILNRMPGPKFQESTIKAVRRAARKLGWKPHCALCRRKDPVAWLHGPRGKRICIVCVEALIADYKNSSPTVCPGSCEVPDVSGPPIPIAPTGPLDPDFGDQRAPKFHQAGRRS